MGLVSQDDTNFFDLLEWDTASHTMLALGCSQNLINADKKLMENIPNIFKIGPALSEPSGRTNSPVQRDSWGIKVSLCMMAIWTMEMLLHGLTTRGFIDDSNFRANNDTTTNEELHATPAEDVWLEQFRNGIDKSAEFDELSVCGTDIKKTKAMSIGKKCRPSFSAC